MMPIKIPREQKLEIVANIQNHFYKEMSDEIGDLAAENLLDFMLKELSPYIYNQAIKDARMTVEQKMIALEEDLYALEKPIR
ncbi:DUF2164 family protein [Bacillus sp. JJ722]|uniref:DUF2164 family protein n=1 Tax=Bacillus sp. JJ722 TaxID=3122973 RepID=UPI0019620662